MQIDLADAEGFEAAVRLMVVAFADDPVCRYLYPDMAQYLAYFPEYVRIYGLPGLDSGATHLAAGKGAALWVPPGRHADEAALDDLLTRSVAPAALRELEAVYAEFDRAHPREPHWFLPLMAVDPWAKKQGIGQALMEHGLAMCDRTGVMAYLESTKPENVPFYARFGFEPYHLIDVGGHPPVTTMVRAPR